MSEIKDDDFDLYQVKRRGQSLTRSAVWNIAQTMTSEPGVPGTQSLHRGLSLLSVVGVMSRDHPQGVALSELARSTGLPKSSLHRLLAALVEAGFVERVESMGTYRLGIQAQVLGRLVASSHDVVDAVAADSLVRLAEISEDTTFLTIRQGSYGLCARREEGPGPIRNNAMGVGDRHPLGVGAGSLAMLSALDDTEINDVFERNADVLARRYPLIDLDSLRGHVATSRANGYALNPGLAAPGSWAIGVAICDENGSPVAAISIASIEQRLAGSRRAALVAALHTEAALIKRSLASHLAEGA